MLVEHGVVHLCCAVLCYGYTYTLPVLAHMVTCTGKSTVFLPTSLLLLSLHYCPLVLHCVLQGPDVGKQLQRLLMKSD